MKTIFKYMEIVIAGLLLLPLVGCSEDDDEPTSLNTDWENYAVGEWFSDLGEPVKSIKEVSISTYKNDGTWFGSLAHVDAYSSYNITVDGTYRISGKQFIQTATMFGETSTYSYQIISLGKYDWLMYFPETEMTDLAHRIVDTIHMEVGQTDYVQINDPDFYPMEYTSNDEEVVEIAATGTFQTKRAGTAYISVVSSIGTAVVRVVVTDPETHIDNFVRYLGEDKSLVTNAYGNICFNYDFGDGTTYQGYDLIDSNISSIGFSYTDNRVDSIDVWLTGTAEIDKIQSAFEKAYTYLTEFGGVVYYRTMKNLRAVKVMYLEDFNAIRIKFYDPNDPIVDLDNLIRMKASEAFKYLGHVLTDEEKEAGHVYLSITDPSNPIFSSVRIEFDADYDYIHNITLYCKNGISVSDIEYWYEQNYTRIDEDSFGQINPLIMVHLFPADEDYPWDHVMYVK